jgi:hypothetical protein
VVEIRRAPYARGVPSPMPSASEILRHTRQVYCDCVSYEDTGDVTLRMATGRLPKGTTQVWHFSTAFVRPDRLRFECAHVAVGPPDEWRRAVAWGRDGAVHSWSSSRPGVQPHDALLVASSRASLGATSALQVISLLVPGADPRHRLSDDGRLIGSEPLEGLACFVVEVDVPGRGTMRIHVDCTSYLMLRTAQRFVIGRAAHEESQRRMRASLDSGEVSEDARAALRELLAREPSTMPDEHFQVLTNFIPVLDRAIEDTRFSFTPPAPDGDRSPLPRPRVTRWDVRSSIRASDVLARMRGAYRACSTYLDTGEVTTTFMKTERAARRTTVLRFSTAFDRSGGFRFEYKAVDVGPESEWVHYVIWDDGSGCRTWWTLQPIIELRATVDLACGEARGVSSASSSRVPTLLKPDEMTCDALPFDALIEGTGRVDGCVCYVLVAYYDDDATLRLWIDERSFLIRRVEEREKFTAESQASMMREASESGADSVSGRASREKDLQRDLREVEDFEVATVTTYRPTVDDWIAPGRFSFTPPFVGPSPL